jgi:Leucine-rich repeat (LRR) protein
MTTESSFLSLGRKPDLDQETAFTICRMIESVGWEIAEDWDWDWLKEERKDYRALLKPAWLKKAWELLSEKGWYSLQTTNDNDKRISTVVPLNGLIHLETLILQNNLIEDLRPLAGMLQLKYLNCHGNRIRDLSPLASFQNIEELSLGNNLINSFAALECLPKLRELHISGGQIPTFIQCKQLPCLEVLVIGDDGDDDNITVVKNLEVFPEMPQLTRLSVHHVQDLAGIERYPRMDTLSVTSGTYGSLTPLKALQNLTHLCIMSSRMLDVEPLSQLNRLRSLRVTCPKVTTLRSLGRLPVLHEISVGEESSCSPRELKELRQDLTDWDIDFKDVSGQRMPSLNIQVVDQATFDIYDSQVAYGIREGEAKGAMLASEHQWLIDKIREALSVTFEQDTDFCLPHTTGFRRSERVIIYTLAGYEAFRQIATTIQRVLCETRNDWIIWCQSLLKEGPDEEEVPEDLQDFIAWIYPDKIVATEPSARIIQTLIEWRHK